MARPRSSFADILDDWLENAPEQEVRDVITRIAIWARWRKFPWKLRLDSPKIKNDNLSVAENRRITEDGIPF